VGGLQPILFMVLMFGVFYIESKADGVLGATAAAKGQQAPKAVPGVPTPTE
jgi:hypothetical protein